ERNLFSPDETRLSVTDTGRMLGSDPQHYLCLDVGSNGKLSGGEISRRLGMTDKDSRPIGQESYQKQF
ncbi:hypothetical protein ACWGS8_35120, partial [Mesorhizobium sp. 43Arga]